MSPSEKFPPIENLPNDSESENAENVEDLSPRELNPEEQMALAEAIERAIKKENNNGK